MPRNDGQPYGTPYADPAKERQRLAQIQRARQWQQEHKAQMSTPEAVEKRRAYFRAYLREYYKRPDVKAKRKAYLQRAGHDIEQRRKNTPKRKASKAAYDARPGVHAKRLAYASVYNRRPDVRAKVNAANIRWKNTQAGRDWLEAYWSGEAGRTTRARTGHRRRAREFALSSQADLTAAQWEAIKATYGYRCAYCHKKPKRLEKDHVLPLSKGGPLTATNVVPACRLCNLRKHNRLVPAQPVLLIV